MSAGRQRHPPTAAAAAPPVATASNDNDGSDNDGEPLQTAQVLNVVPEVMNESRSLAALDYKVAVGGGAASDDEDGGGGSAAVVGGDPGPSGSHVSEDPPGGMAAGDGGSLLPPPPPQQPQYQQQPPPQQQPPSAAAAAAAALGPATMATAASDNNSSGDPPPSPRQQQQPQQPSAYHYTSNMAEQKERQYYGDDDVAAEGGGGANNGAPAPTPPVGANDDNKKRKRLVHMGAAVLVLLAVAAAAVGGVCGSGNCGGGTTSSSAAAEESPSSPEKAATAPPAAPPVAAATDPPVGNGGTATAAPVGDPTVTTTSAPTAGATAAAATKLGRIAAAGQLSCGVTDVAGQSELNASGQRVGFSVDLCRAVAAAIFGTSEGTLTVTPVDATDRFQLLNDGTVDLLAASVSHTMERDLYEPTTQVGYTFSIPYLYGGMVFAGVPEYAECADTLNATCAGVRVCAVDGSTYVDRVTELLPDASLTVAPTMDAFYQRLRDGLCNVLAGDQFEVSQSAVEQNGYFGDYAVGETLFSKEPLALVTTEEDPTWSDFVNWVVQGLLAAEEQEFTQERASFFAEDPVFGDEFGSMFINALSEVGNYEEMYERHLAPILPRTDANTINDGTNGLLFAMPFGDMTASGPNPVDGGTLQAISDRGFLRCGITRRALFAQLDTASQEWSGLDVDFCKALSAAIFDGVTSSVVYSVLPATDRFLALANGQVDVLSRITTVTLSRDVNEPSSGVGFSFSQPDFYDGLSFGGIPPFGICADTLDTTSGDCQGLLICYNEGTTFAEILAGLFPARFLVARQSGDLVAEGLATGVCNAVAGGVVDVSVSNIRSIGQYEGEYETGSGRFSKDPLALVTRQDDPQWSAYVYWILSAIFYAEEQGISAASSLDMPIVNLFGALHTRMFRDAIEAVGSYADIYQRNIGDEAPRGGLNLLNTNPLGPQHYPLPGL